MPHHSSRTNVFPVSVDPICTVVFCFCFFHFFFAKKVAVDWKKVLKKLKMNAAFFFRQKHFFFFPSKEYFFQPRPLFFQPRLFFYEYSTYRCRHAVQHAVQLYALACCTAARTVLVVRARTSLYKLARTYVRVSYVQLHVATSRSSMCKS